MGAIVVQEPDVTDLALPDEVHKSLAVVVKSVEAHEFALETMQHCRRMERKITDHFEPARAALDKAKKELLVARDKLVEPYEHVRKELGKKCDVFEFEQKEKARIEAARLEDEARKAASEAAVQESILAEEFGQPEAAAEILAAPVVVAPVVVAPEVATVEGTSVRGNWKGEVTNLLELVKHVASHPDDLNLLMANGPAINSAAKASKGLKRIPGLHFYQESVRSFRG